MTTSVTVVLVLSLLLFAVRISTGEVRTDPILFNFRFNRSLNVPNSAKMQSTLVKDMMGCLASCANARWCKSGNLKTKPERNGLFVCEVLPSDEFNKNNSLTKNKAFRHFRIRTPCEIFNRKRCLNQGECVFKDQKHQCKCVQGFRGEECEKGGLDESSILTNYGNVSYLNTLLGYLEPYHKGSQWVTCWNTSSDGWDVNKSFHPQCDGKGPTVTIVRVGSYVFGGYSDVSWHTRRTCSYSNKSFIYSLFNINGYQPMKLDLVGGSNPKAVCGYLNYGPYFYMDLRIVNLASSKKESTTYRFRYQPPPGCSEYTHCPFYAGESPFTPSQIEVFYVKT